MTKSIKNVGGRPTLKQKEIVQKLEHWFHLDMCVETCCEYAGISKQTYYNRVKDDEGFSTKMKRAQADLKYIAHKKLKELIESWDKQAVLRWLNRRDTRYWEKITFEEENKKDKNLLIMDYEHGMRVLELRKEAKRKRAEKEVEGGKSQTITW